MLFILNNLSPKSSRSREKWTQGWLSKRLTLGKLLLWQNQFSKLSALFLRKTISSWVCHMSFHLTAESDNSENASFALFPPTHFSVVFISSFKTTVLLYYLFRKNLQDEAFLDSFHKNRNCLLLKCCIFWWFIFNFDQNFLTWPLSILCMMIF